MAKYKSRFTGEEIDRRLDSVQVGNLSGYVYLDDIAQLPDKESTIGYIIGDELYVYVGEGGDTNSGTYKNVGDFRGPIGPAGPKGEAGESSPVWTIGEDGYWYQDGEKTDNKALGEKGEQGVQGAQGIQGEKGDGWQLKGFVDSVDVLPSSGSVGDLYLVGTSEPYDAYVYKNSTSKFVNIGNALEVKASIFDGGRADTIYGGAREINCGGADAYLTY